MELIDRLKTIKALDEAKIRTTSEEYDRILDVIGSMPTIEERKTGKWIEKDGWDGDVYYDCSVCGESWITIEGTPWENGMNYCPHCGAKMEGEKE